MKTIAFLFFIFLVQFSFAQKSDTIAYSGIFINYQDYKGNKLSYEVNCDSSSGKIKLNHFLSKNYIDVFKKGKKIQLYKDSIFGFRDCHQNDYRFFTERDKEYQILENKTIVIYVADVAVTSANGKAREFVKKYFFSTTLNSAILPLTISNLKNSFPDNVKFHNKLDQEFSSEKDISTFDNNNKMYKVNYLLSQSVLNQNK